MDSKVRRRHLHASVMAATLYGMATGWWLGARAPHARWLESFVFVAVLMFAPVVVMSRIDAKYKYED